MIARVVAIVALLVATAQADAIRKPPAIDLTPPATAEFIEGRIADKDNDLNEAIKRYRKSIEILPSANTYYNLADVYRRVEDFEPALEMYRKYLELAPKASDRAAVEKRIQDIETAPFVVWIQARDLHAGVTLLDGKVIKTPAAVTVSDGKHFAERITKHGFVREEFDTKRKSRRRKIELGTDPAPGNVVLTAGYVYPGYYDRVIWKRDAGDVEPPARLTLTPGRHKVDLEMHSGGPKACKPLEIDVARGDVITYVRIDHPPGVEANRRPATMPCATMTYSVQYLKLP